MHAGLYGRIDRLRAPASPPIIRNRFDPIYAHRDFGIGNGNGAEPEDAALQKLFDDGAGRVIVFEGPLLTVFHTRPLYVRSNTRIIGNGATIKAHPVADINCTGIHLTSETWLGSGPSNVIIQDLRYDGNAVSRRAAGVLLPYLGVGQFGQAAAFYLINAENCIIDACSVINAVSDCFYMGGTVSDGSSTNSHFRNCYAKNSSRNGFSFVGTQNCTASGCVSKDHNYGNSNSNISCGFDVEPDGAATANYGLILSGCIATDCTTAGFACNNSAYNYSVTWAYPYTRSCAVGFHRASAGGTKIFAAQYNFNTTNFDGITEKISGF
ncbi:right-handed parallel beta-helix repeat-containing protein [Rhodoplanes elegans]|uniref:right-handed parallel beta-helix repeat-containing protein n=1 Tax=Rhodoplanes elegans TaxID=29408 RepID=UPI0011B9421A|nr:right-handed parallel beta-helix repeat-containing protein [Rhodoplanes elegans]